MTSPSYEGNKIREMQEPNQINETMNKWFYEILAFVN